LIHDCCFHSDELLTEMTHPLGGMQTIPAHEPGMKRAGSAEITINEVRSIDDGPTEAASLA
jgi:hypothetical protein